MKIGQKFIERVVKEGTVDTSNYRYCVKEFPDRMEVRRLPIHQLDTTAAIDGWETVAVVR